MAVVFTRDERDDAAAFAAAGWQAHLELVQATDACWCSTRGARTIDLANSIELTYTHFARNFLLASLKRGRQFANDRFSTNRSFVFAIYASGVSGLAVESDDVRF